ncbi:hypothetical protein D3C81_731650 [compost metagenome]
MVVKHIHLTRTQIQIPQRLNRRTGIRHRPSPTRGDAVAVQVAANGHVTAAEDQAVFAVVECRHADVEALARRDGGCHAAFHVIVDGAAGYAQMVAVDAARAHVVQCADVQLRADAVDHATVIQQTADVDACRARVDVAGACIIKIGCAQGQHAEGLDLPCIGQRSADGDIPIAIGHDLGACVQRKVAGQVQRQVFL